MRQIALFLFTMAFAASSYAASPQETLASFYAALVAGDTGKASELLSPEVLIYESGYVERSRADYVGHHMAGDMTYAKTTKNTVLRQGERIEGNIAVLWEETETTGMAGEKPVHQFGTTTALLEKKGETWTIVHLHWSSRKAK